MKPDCKYGEKCYRKDPIHLAAYIHNKKDKDEDEDSNSPPPKPKLKRNKTHELSFEDEDPMKIVKKKEEKMEDDDEDEAAPPKPTLKKLRSRSISIPDENEKKKDEKEDEKKDEEEEMEIDDGREDCKYWEKCYRKDPGHYKQYRHPADGKPRKSKRPKSKNKLDDGEEKNVAGGFRLKRIGSHFSCTCIGWKTQKNAPNKRTCKHLREFLGDEYEKSRVGRLPVKKEPKAEPTKHFSHLNVSLLLAHKYDEKSIDPTGWWMSEKLDGVRAFWNGKCFYSRLGNPFYAPAWFTKDLPKDMHLDGELFGGRKKFQSTVSIVKTPECDAWKKIKYHVFDAPNLGKEPFEKRMKAVREYFEDHSPQYAEYCKQTKCTGKQEIKDELKKVIALGGEGLMIREPGSKYERKRSHTLLKIKKFYDAEAVVIGYDPGKGKFQGQVGALRCKMAKGTVFSVGSGMTDKDHRHPPKIGSIITYKFQEYTNSGTPRFPTFLGIRIDMDKPKDAELPPLPDDI